MKDWMKKESEYKDDIESLKAFAKHEDEQMKQSPIDEFKIEFKKLNSFNDPANKLRDHFAGLAMNAFLQSPFQMQKLTGDTNENDTLLAITCYRVADAMLKARKEVYGE